MKTQKSINIGSLGYYSLDVLDSKGNPVKGKKVERVNNVITFSGAYSQLFEKGTTGPLWSNLGTGTVERVRTDIGLGQESGSRSDFSYADRSGNEVDNLDGTSTLTLTRVYSLGIGAKVGTFSEVGLFDSSSSGTLVAGQLIKDEFGSPTTITLLSDEQLIITYTLEWTVNNISSQVGTGIVTDNASNDYNYAIFAQPYFNAYANPSEGDNATATSPVSNGQTEIAVRAANGTTNFNFNPINSGSMSVSHNGSGTVTMIMTSGTIAPNEGTFTDGVFFTLLRNPGRSTLNSVMDIVDLAVPRISSDDLYGAHCIIKFSDPITKTSSFSFRIGGEIVYAI